jgi:hypothetical protein
MGKLGNRDWSLLGAASAEDRCMGALDRAGTCDGRAYFLAVHDPDPFDKMAFEAAINGRKNQIKDKGVPESNIIDVPLFADLDFVSERVEVFLELASPHVLVDISSLPKRWFFPLLKVLLSSHRVETLVTAYASPNDYGGVLAENPDPIKMLPGFSGDGSTEYDSVVVGIGFEPLGVSNLFTELKLGRIRLLFPFPPGPPAFIRNWMFVKLIEDMTDTREIAPPDRIGIHLFDCPQIFDAIGEISESGTRTVALAPYGPKPMSLAMCLFSIAAGEAGRPRVPVYYSQPRRYALDYSTGVRDVSAYCVKLAGRNLYAI